MNVWLRRTIGPGLAFVLTAGPLQAQTVARAAESGHQALVNRYCAGCHNDRRASGGFSWTTIDLADPARNAVAAEKVVKKLRTGLMPPSGAPRPDRASAQALATVIEQAIDRRAAAQPHAGLPELHRLNRTEYRNAVRELLALDVNVSSLLPPDESGRGFDNMSDALTITPSLVQGYVRAAGRISREAVGDREAAPAETMYRVPKVVNQMRHIDGAPLGTRGGTVVVHHFPVDGEYTFRLQLYYDYLETLFGQSLPPNLQGQEIEVSIDGARVAIFKIDPNVPETKNVLLSPRVAVTAGPHRVAAAFISKFDGPTEDLFRQVEKSMIDISAGVPGFIALPHLLSMTVAGPFAVTGLSETPSRKRIFACKPASAADEASCAQSILDRLARQAFRRPVTPAETEFLFSYYKEGRKDGGFEGGIQRVVQAILANPNFVFRFERTPSTVTAGTNYRISDLELASRLSFFLWSSVPDEQLVTLAAAGKLSEPAVLEREVRRMLADRRATALADNFAYQWLRLQSMKEIDPDGGLFPNFTRNLSHSMTTETKLLFEHIMRADRPILELLTADYTHVDEVLARHYGIPNVQGSAFRRVPVTDANRQGLLGHGSVLTLTSLANRTSPVMRGKYVLEVLLGTAPPPPPPNVPAFMESVENQKVLSVRERLETHRKSPACSACHAMMDPIGLSLENFDAVGVWRSTDRGALIDTTSELYDGTKIDGPVSLRHAILARSDSFITSFTENLLTYGLGRLIDHRDMPAVRAIQRDAAASGHRFSAFVLGVVKSTPFQMRQADAAVTSQEIGKVGEKSEGHR
jgi:mono/diheme cytochrome c family protein